MNNYTQFYQNPTTTKPIDFVHFTSRKKNLVKTKKINNERIRKVPVKNPKWNIT